MKLEYYNLQILCHRPVLSGRRGSTWYAHEHAHHDARFPSASQHSCCWLDQPSAAPPLMSIVPSCRNPILICTRMHHMASSKIGSGWAGLIASACGCSWLLVHDCDAAALHARLCRSRSRVLLLALDCAHLLGKARVLLRHDTLHTHRWEGGTSVLRAGARYHHLPIATGKPTYTGPIPVSDSGMQSGLTAAMDGNVYFQAMRSGQLENHT